MAALFLLVLYRQAQSLHRSLQLREYQYIDLGSLPIHREHPYQALQHIAQMIGEGEIIVPPLTWISDISSVLFAGHKLVFVDINLQNLSFCKNKKRLNKSEQEKNKTLSQFFNKNRYCSCNKEVTH